MTLAIAKKPGDYKKAHALLRAEGFPGHELTFPTVLSSDKDGVNAVLGTSIQDGMIVAGPLVLHRDKQRVLTAFRMMEAYDNILRNMGIICYILPVEHDGIVERVIERYYPHVTPYSIRDGYKFYNRYLDGSWEAPYDQDKGQGTSSV